MADIGAGSMDEQNPNSVSGWIARMKQGEDSAVQHLWDRYFGRMVEVARARMPEGLRPVIGSEDIALSAFFDVVEAARGERLPRLHDREDLWRLLLAFTLRKAVDHFRREQAQRRGGGKVVLSPEQIGEALDVMPSPEREAMVRDQLARLLALLPDEPLRRLVQARLDGHSNAEIAILLGCSERTIERRLQLVRKLWEQDFSEG